MGDENSLAGRTQAHKHTALSSDGGFLDANSITGFSNTSTGSMLYMDASGQATDLGIGAANTSLQSNGTVPGWQSAGAAARTILDSQQFVNWTGDTITWTPASAIDDTTYQRLQLVIAGNSLSNNISAQYFRLDSGLTNANYNQNGIELNSGALTYVTKNPQSAGDDYNRIVDDTGTHTWLTLIDLVAPTQTDTDMTTFNYQFVNEDRWVNGSGYVTGLGTGISRMQVEFQKPANAADINWVIYGIAY